MRQDANAQVDLHSKWASATNPGKRCFDVFAVLVLLILVTPLLLLVALAVKLDDGGPVLFHQHRVGRAGRLFRIAKFRTMAVDAEARLEADPVLYARYLKNDCKLDLLEDPRVSRLGCFLRATSLDELPQLVNVLRGDMSLVGPRPVVLVELGQYTERGAAGAYLAARPGLTGLWQISGRNLLGYNERVDLDRTYVETFSCLTDLKILVRTPLVVLRREGVR